MKKLLLLLTLCLAASTAALAQTVWAPAGATWYYDYSNGFGVEGYIEIRYIGDSLVAGQNTKVLQKSTYLYDHWKDTYKTDTFGYEYTYMSNDTVYFYRLGDFHVLYNFNADSGDSWTTAGTEMHTPPCDSTGEINVDSTGTSTYNGQTLKYLHVSGDQGAHWSIGNTIVERIGSLSYMFPEPMCVTDAGEGGPLRCYSDNTFGTYSTGISSACDFIVGLQDKAPAELTFEAYPNPSTDFINITMPGINHDNYIINIFSSTGQEVKTIQALTTGTIQADISELHKGIYLMTITNSEGRQGNKTIIKY